MTYEERLKRRVMNRKIFKQSSEFLTRNETLWEETRVSTLASTLYKEDDEIVAGDDITECAKVILSKRKSANAALSYKGKKVAIHNFASAREPGGGVRGGSGAQEESLCRVSNLYYVINNYMLKDFYSIHHEMESEQFLCTSALIYSPDIIIFKEDNDEFLPLDESEWKKVDIVTLAAPNLNFGICSDSRLRNVFFSRFDRLLSSASKNGCEVVITGAFGCGAFHNNPFLVAEELKKAIKKYSRKLEVIELAVYCNDDETSNYEAFKAVLEDLPGFTEL